MQHVVCGIDGTAESLAAADLAAAEAALREARLELIGVVASPGDEPRMVGALGHAAQRAAAAEHGIDVITTLAHGDPAPILARLAEGADVLVVGRRRGAITRLRSTLVVGRIAGHAAVPVLVAQGTSDRGANVLVGVGQSEATQAAMAFAFAEAQMRGTGVTAVHAWHSPVIGSHGSGGAGGGWSMGTPAADNFDAARLLAESIAGWRPAYPGVQVRRALPEGSPADALVHLSVYAQMLVVADGRGPRSSVIIHDLIRRALCPLVIVHPQYARQERA